MKRILVYRHPRCERCARIARFHHKIDWFDRIADTTAIPPTGPLKMGEIVVEELATKRILQGAEGLALIYRQAPLYWLLMPLLWIPPMRALMDRKSRGGVDARPQAGSDGNHCPRLDHHT
jgi:hypothetical protein